MGTDSPLALREYYTIQMVGNTVIGRQMLFPIGDYEIIGNTLRKD